MNSKTTPDTSDQTTGTEDLGDETPIVQAANTRGGQMALDAERIEYLAKLIRNCPHVQITYCDDPDCEEGAVGFMIRVEGCETSEVCAPTLHECIDKDMALHLSENATKSSTTTGVVAESEMSGVLPPVVGEELWR